MNINDYEYLNQKLQEQKAELNGKIDALAIKLGALERDLTQRTTYTPRQFIASEVSQFLLDAGFEEASKAVDCEFEL